MFSAVCACLCHGAAAADAVPLEVFGRLPSLEDVAISPDGTKIAFVLTNGDNRSLRVASLAKPEVLGGARIGKVKLRDVEWADDDNILATISSTSPPPFGFIGATREWYQLVNFNISKMRVNSVSFDLSPEVETFNVITGDTSMRDVSGHATIFTRGFCVRQGTVPCLFSLAYPDRRVRLVDEAWEPYTEWLVDESGKMAAQFMYHDAKKLWEIRTRKNAHWTVVASGTAAVDTPDMLGFSADGTGLIVRFVENGDPEWRPLNLARQHLGTSAGAWRGVFERYRGSQDRTNHRRHSRHR